jgi:hypothetical protein
MFAGDGPHKPNLPLCGETVVLVRFLQTGSFQPAVRSDVLAITNVWPLQETRVE